MRINGIESFEPTSDQFGNEFWWILQISVDDDNRLSLRMFEPCRQGNLLANPGVYTLDGGTETWKPGANCFLCAPDGGPYACDNPIVQDAGP